ncbi:hypothetical protein FH609_029405 [Streptomyces sp. 3MP-14]|uniref:Uncharacterized protein n=1 Tax=Streptomyces mimosae TaxID=2586635 RepID=A0A5N5ZSH9_9ACTN|nr:MULTISPECIES: hypothetical protein [Streptomyces]KAB8159464.1 hypothetical protein FH607_028410 [Streptomyces mimosae]KAB8172648.1 hypothetical protein FH609_029405 [Streptomyces sp. 3MP-14]
MPDSQQRLLLTSAAKPAAMAGWCSYDSADHGPAERCMIQALRLCTEIAATTTIGPPPPVRTCGVLAAVSRAK